MEVQCPECAEQDELHGRPEGDVIVLSCDRCGAVWSRDPSPRCQRCGRRGLRAVPLAIVEKGRGTQLSVVGTRTIHLCPDCDHDTLERWHRNRPNPLMPDQVPTSG